MGAKKQKLGEELSEQGELALGLFDSLIPAGSSATIELYDSIPYYSNSRYESDKSVEDRPFRFRDSVIHAKITAAQVQNKDGSTKSVFPGPREELVESAVRKIMVQKISEKVTCLQLDPTNEEGYSLVAFIGLKEIFDELAESGHTFSRPEIREALELLQGTMVKLSTQKGNAKVTKESHAILNYSQVEEKLGRGERVIYRFSFHPLVAVAIPRMDYRRYNQALSTRLQTIVARYLHRRMSHRFTQASRINPYVLSLKGLLSDSAPLPKKPLPLQRDSVIEALNEMEKVGILAEPFIISTEESIPAEKCPPDGKGYQFEERYQKPTGRGRPKLHDVIFYLYPSQDFVDDAIHANQDLVAVKKRNLKRIS